ncbi:MAG: hypothetical protein HT579_00005 [Candidatus Accumulibacter similis]|nr:MAG: hypothetical protein HT579_03755 [Candidatus Accumulibacter similis]QKS31408.1 MAG: hypothetical protein HT579_00005 [Candidatus Accumulibacter similis]
MKISLTTSGLFDPPEFRAWTAQRQREIHAAVARGFRESGREVAAQARVQMQSALQIRRAGFLKSLRATVFDRRPDRLPALRIGSRVPWLGIHESGGTISGRMLIPLLPEHQRIGRKRFRAIIDGLMRSGNAFFIQRGGQAILMAENIRENDRELARFKRAERARTGVKRLQRGQEIPVAVLVRSVSLKKRLDLEGTVRRNLPRIAEAIRRELKDV